MALIDSIKDAVTKVLPQKESMPPSGGSLVHEEDVRLKLRIHNDLLIVVCR